MKKFCYSAFIAFWSCIATLLAVNVLATGEKEATAVTPGYSLEEVAAHAAEDDCWLVIEGKVYDISTYMARHPTPPSVLLPWCGKEATEGMRTKGYGRDHSSTAWAMLEEFQIGVLTESAP